MDRKSVVPPVLKIPEIMPQSACAIRLHKPWNLGQLRNSPPTGPLRVAELPGEANPVIFSVHDEIARHYGVDEKNLPESHAATIDYVVAAAGG